MNQPQCGVPSENPIGKDFASGDGIGQ